MNKEELTAEKIEQAAKDFAGSNYQKNHSSQYDSRKMGFIAGAKWAMQEYKAQQPTTESEIKAGDSWLEYIKQFPKLEVFWQSIPEPTNIWLRQQIDIFAGKYPASQPTPTGEGEWKERFSEWRNFKFGDDLDRGSHHRYGASAAYDWIEKNVVVALQNELTRLKAAPTEGEQLTNG